MHILFIFALHVAHTFCANGSTPLHAAARAGKVVSVEQLLDDGAVIDARDGHLALPLHYAALNTTSDVSMLLIGRDLNIRCNINLQKNNGRTPLHIAACGSCAETVALLLENGAKADCQDTLGRTPLHYAAMLGRVDIVRVLLDWDTDTCRRVRNLVAGMWKGSKNSSLVNIPDTAMLTPLHFAVKHENLIIATMLLASGAELAPPNSSAFTPLHVAASAGQVDMVRLLLASGDAHLKLYTSPDSPQRRAAVIGVYTPLHEAAKHGHLDVATILLENNFDVNAVSIGEDSIYKAIRHNHFDMVNLLLDHGATVGTQICTLIHRLGQGALDGHVDTVKRLLQRGGIANAFASLDEDYLCEAAEMNRPDVILFLLDNGANVNAPNLFLQTPLHFAARNGHFFVASILLTRGANVNCEDYCRKTPLYYAFENGHFSIVKLLLANGATIDTFVHRKWDIVPYVMRLDHYEMLKLLLQLREKDTTAEPLPDDILFESVRKGRARVVSLLLDHGAMDIAGTLLQTAVTHAHANVVATLLSHGADIDGTETDSPPVPSRITRSIWRYWNSSLNWHWCHYETIIALLQDPRGKVTVREVLAWSHLHFLAYTGRPDALVSQRPTLNLKDLLGFNPIHYAALRGHGDTIMFLAQNGADVNVQNRFGHSPLHCAAMNGNAATVTLLLSHGAMMSTLDARNHSPLRLAVVNNHHEAVRVLLAHGAYAAEPKHTLLLHAALLGHLETVNVFVEMNVGLEERDLRGRTPLHVAAAKGHVQIIRTLKSKISVTDDRGQTPAHYAARSGLVCALAALDDANLFAMDKYKVTPLMLAALGGHLDMIAYIMGKAGGSVHIIADALSGGT